MAHFFSHRIPHRYAGVVMPLLLSLLMTFVVSFISTVRVNGLSVESLQAWPGAWGLSWLVAFPTLLGVLPLVRRLVTWLVAPIEG